MLIRRLLANVLIVLASSAFAFLGVELAYRFWQGVPILATDNYVLQMLDLVRQNSGALDFDTDLGWRLRENLGTPAGGFTTGRHGLRLNGGPAVKPLQGDVLAVGDSFTAGSGVRDDETWPARLETITGLKVLNGAAGAWGVDQMVLRAEKLMPEVKPKVLIVSALAQDSLRNSYDLYGGGYKPYFVIENGKAILRGQPVPRVDAKPMKLGWVRRAFGHSYFVHSMMLKLGKSQVWIDDRYRYRKVHSDQMGVEISCHLMDRLAELKKVHDVRVIVMVQYGAQEATDAKAPWYGPPVLECARKRGLDTMDTHPSLHALSVADRKQFESLWLIEGGQLGHMSPQGNTFIAQLLKEAHFAH
jgi:hypothetical protein